MLHLSIYPKKPDQWGTNEDLSHKNIEICHIFHLLDDITQFFWKTSPKQWLFSETIGISWLLKIDNETIN